MNARVIATRAAILAYIDDDHISALDIFYDNHNPDSPDSLEDEFIAWLAYHSINVALDIEGDLIYLDWSSKVAARFAYAEQKKTHNVYAVELNEEGKIIRATVPLSYGQLGSDPSLFSGEMVQLDEKSTKFFNDRSQFDLLTTNQARRIANSLYPES